MNIYEANMFDSRKLNLRLFTNAMPESKICMLVTKPDWQLHYV